MTRVLAVPGFLEDLAHHSLFFSLVHIFIQVSSPEDDSKRNPVACGMRTVSKAGCSLGDSSPSPPDAEVGETGAPVTQGPSGRRGITTVHVTQG